MPGRLAFHLPFVPEADRQVLYGSILAASTFPRDSPVRLGAIAGKKITALSLQCQNS